MEPSSNKDPSIIIPQSPCWELTCDDGKNHGTTTTTASKSSKETSRISSRSLVAELYKKGLSSNERLSNGQFAGDFALAHVISHLQTRRRNYAQKKLRQKSQG